MLVRALDTDRFTVPDALPFVQWHRGSKPTAVLLVDGLSPNISHFLRAIYHQLGNRVSYWGGGAGSLTLQPRPCVFTREGVHQGAAIIALSTLPSRLGVRHGWRELKGPFVATRSDRNAIIQLNWRNAFDVYRSTVEADAGVTITPRTSSGWPAAIPSASARRARRCWCAIRWRWARRQPHLRGRRARERRPVHPEGRGPPAGVGGGQAGRARRCWTATRPGPSGLALPAGRLCLAQLFPGRALLRGAGRDRRRLGGGAEGATRWGC
jgi:hypothetical protein